MKNFEIAENFLSLAVELNPENEVFKKNMRNMPNNIKLVEKKGERSSPAIKKEKPQPQIKKEEDK